MTARNHPSHKAPRSWVACRHSAPCPYISSADKCIQNVYRDIRLQRKSTEEHTGILFSLLVQDKLPLDDIKASVTEMMAGGVDTVSTGRGVGGGNGNG